ncbi:CNH domain-containing protein, partial [Mycena epipterygia]
MGGQSIQLRRYNSNLVFKPGKAIDINLLDDNRSLIYTGKVLYQSDNDIPSRENEVLVMLFDNYIVMAEPQEEDGVTKYHVNRRPIPLDLVTLVNFTDPPTQSGAGLLAGDLHDPNGTVASTSPEIGGDSRAVYPFTIHQNGRLGGTHVLFAESAEARTKWKQKLEEAFGIGAVNRVFELETLSADTFFLPRNRAISLTGKVTCSVPFHTADGRGLVAIGCAEGLWIGLPHDPKCECCGTMFCFFSDDSAMRRVLHLKMVTQCAMLDTFGIFIVLADKSLFAYHIETLVPPLPQHTSSDASRVPQKLNGTKDVHFFSIGTLNNRTLVVYMTKKRPDSILRVLEPVDNNINPKFKTPVGLGPRLGFRSTTSEQWFRIYREFFLPSNCFDIYFLKAKIAILCTMSIEIMDLNNFKSVTMPMRDTASLDPLSRRLDACRPIGIFRANDDVFLLCYRGGLQ